MGLEGTIILSEEASTTPTYRRLLLPRLSLRLSATPAHKVVPIPLFSVHLGEILVEHNSSHFRTLQVIRYPLDKVVLYSQHRLLSSVSHQPSRDNRPLQRRLSLRRLVKQICNLNRLSNSLNLLGFRLIRISEGHRLLLHQPAIHSGLRSKVLPEVVSLMLNSQYNQMHSIPEAQPPIVSLRAHLVRRRDFPPTPSVLPLPQM